MRRTRVTRRPRPNEGSCEPRGQELEREAVRIADLIDVDSATIKLRVYPNPDGVLGRDVDLELEPRRVAQVLVVESVNFERVVPVPEEPHSQSLSVCVEQRIQPVAGIHTDVDGNALRARRSDGAHGEDRPQSGRYDRAHACTASPSSRRPAAIPSRTCRGTRAPGGTP